MLLLQPTSPLRRLEDVEKILDLFNGGFNSIVSVTPSSKHPAWMFSLSSDQLLQPLSSQLASTSRRQDLSPAYELNGALYLASVLSLSERVRS